MKNRPSLFLLLAILTLLPVPVAGSDTRDRIEVPVQQAIDTRRATQEAETEWRVEKEKLMTRFESLKQEQTELQKQKKVLQEQTDIAKTRVASKKRQLSDIQEIESRMSPFLIELMDVLETQFSTSLPFLTEERRQRITRLEQLMNDPEITISERYRKLMEALLVETEYGFTTEVSRETIVVTGKRLLVNIFRLGRLSLFYQSLDGSECGYFNVVGNDWEPLSVVHGDVIDSAVDIAAKRKSVELLAMPVGRLVTP